MVASYINNLKNKYNKEIEKNNKDIIKSNKAVGNVTKLEELPTTLSFSKYKEMWEISNPKFASELDDNLYAKLGSKIIEILEYSDFLSKELHLTKDKHKEYRLVISAQDQLPKNNKPFTLPTRLPMICPPKPYADGLKGGYMLNDDLYDEGLFIDKKAYKYPSKLSKGNYIYDMVNRTSSTPFKINRDVLDYLNHKGEEQNLIINTSIKHEFEDLPKPRPLQKKKLAAYNSKKLLQETILGIAEFYTKFDKFYFPVRLDQRGRLYCTPNFFNYQSNELSKALILFDEPGIVKRTDKSSMKYLISYGVNCFGGKIAKESLAKKLEWLEKNKENILDFQNGILIGKASDKLLFLAFCFEYKRYVDFLEDENQMFFYTHLPIQLDATCNGFQHMSLLSNEEVLFKELNLVSDKDNQPRDFYSFVLHRLMSAIDRKVRNNEFKDSEEKESYERLSRFIWERKDIKKAVMTIPYNVSKRYMKDYLVEFLDEVEDNSNNIGNSNNNRIRWYGNINNKLHRINSGDLTLLSNLLYDIIMNDYDKIKRLSSYLKNVGI